MQAHQRLYTQALNLYTHNYWAKSKQHTGITNILGHTVQNKPTLKNLKVRLFFN